MKPLLYKGLIGVLRHCAKKVGVGERLGIFIFISISYSYMYISFVYINKNPSLI